VIVRHDGCHEGSGQEEERISLPRSPGNPKWRLPLISHHALASVAAGDIGEFALEGGSSRPAVKPFLFHGGSD
jgi:hypothetical protein